jgi:hypothetical protein
MRPQAKHYAHNYPWRTTRPAMTLTRPSRHRGGDPAEGVARKAQIPNNGSQDDRFLAPPPWPRPAAPGPNLGPTPATAHHESAGCEGAATKAALISCWRAAPTDLGVKGSRVQISPARPEHPTGCYGLSELALDGGEVEPRLFVGDLAVAEGEYVAMDGPAAAEAMEAAAH